MCALTLNGFECKQCQRCVVYVSVGLKPRDVTVSACFRRDDDGDDPQSAAAALVSRKLPRIPSEGLDSVEDLRRHGRQGQLETRTGRIQAVDDLLLSE